MDDMTLASYIAMHRMKQGLTQRQLSELMRYSTPQFVYNWEHKRSLPPMNKDTILRLAKHLGVRPRELVLKIRDEKLKKIKDSVEGFINDSGL